MPTGTATTEQPAPLRAAVQNRRTKIARELEIISMQKSFHSIESQIFASSVPPEVWSLCCHRCVVRIYWATPKGSRDIFNVHLLSIDNAEIEKLRYIH
jgi:hypothetical protein